jgi:outer membrane lipoprotein-sorting protein
MFLVILLLVVLLSFTVKEGMESKEKVNEIYDNYKNISKSLEDYKGKFNSLVM